MIRRSRQIWSDKEVQKADRLPKNWTGSGFREAVRAASKTAGIPFAIMMDTQGLAIRTGDLAIPLELKPGDIFGFTVKGAQSEEEKSVDVNYPNLVKDPRRRYGAGG